MYSFETKTNDLIREEKTFALMIIHDTYITGKIYA